MTITDDGLAIEIQWPASYVTTFETGAPHAGADPLDDQIAFEFRYRSDDDDDGTAQRAARIDRPTLAALWSYSSFQALSRGVVTPKGDNKIILFVTEEKQQSAEQYTDRLNGDLLQWEGPSDHFAEDRMVRSKTSGEEIHVFYRARHHLDFIYLGQVEVLKHVPRNGKPSEFRTACSLTSKPLLIFLRLHLDEATAKNGAVAD